jgi:RNase H-fold protein (predicted Holliday junction resolvase)
MIIFGISIGTTRTGVAILKDGALQCAEIHRFMTPWSDEKLAKIINQYRQYIEKYKPTAIMVKVPPSSKHNGAIKAVMAKIELLAEEYNCALDFITKSELKDRTGMRTTAELIEWTKRLYPDLAALYEKGQSNDHNYYKKLYEAVLSAHVYQQMQSLREVGNN